MNEQAARRERFLGARRDTRRCVLEGLHAVKHARRFGADFEEVVAREDSDLAALVDRLAPDLEPWIHTAVTRVGATEYEQLAPLAHPTGVMALASRPDYDAAAILAGPRGPVVFLEEPVHLGNVGAAVRVVAAADGAGLLCSGRHDPWSPESVRAAAGLHFAVPVARVDSVADHLHRLVALDADAPPLAETALPERPILAFGSERQGLSSGLIERAAVRASLPMRDGVSSLNLATAVAAVLYSLRAVQSR